MPERIITDVQDNKRMLFFNKDSAFSNFYPCTIIAFDGERFNCAEQYYQAQKCKFAGDYHTLQFVKQATNGREAKAATKHLRRQLTSEWDYTKANVLYDIVFLKFTQNADLSQRLINTDDCFMVEANPSDLYFGSGLAIEDSRNNDPTFYRGQNVMGQILEQVRDRLRPPLPTNPHCRSVLLCPSS